MSENVFKARSPALVAKLIVAGLEPLETNYREVTFIRSAQLQQIVDVFVDAARNEQPKRRKAKWTQ
jgi:hypothetical protein